MNTGHGHVIPRPDGVKARCGGPALCRECRREATQAAPSAKPDERKRFEHWLDYESDLSHDANGGAWKAWQARAALDGKAAGS